MGYFFEPDETSNAPLTKITLPLPEINIIVAMAQNRVIGNNNATPWHLPEDLHYFKRITLGYGLIMGRKTWESIGHPLPHRTNTIITRSPDYKAEDCHIASSLADAIDYTSRLHQKIFIIGGGEIYSQALPLAHIIHITLLHRSVPGNIFFPDIPPDLFTLQQEKQYQWSETVTVQRFTRNTEPASL
jgi:dihydrofolate reductase